MAGRILVGLAILTLSTSAALAAQRAHYYGHPAHYTGHATGYHATRYYGHPTRAYFHHPVLGPINAYSGGPAYGGLAYGGPAYGGPVYGGPMNAYAMAPYPGPVGPGWMGGIKQSDYEMYLKNLHDSGYDPKNDYNNGIMRTN